MCHGHVAGSSPSGQLHFNHQFVLSRARHFAPDGRYLDYGCGAGETVAAGVAMGLDVFGCEVFYGGGSAEGAARRTGLFESRIRDMPDGRIPFEDESFDFVFHNQVFEHVEDIGLALRELHRVLKPSGAMLSVFPSREVWREGHCGVALAHRFDAGSRIGYHYLRVAHRLGFGYNRGQKSSEQWAADFQVWLRDWCHYRTRSELREQYYRAGFTLEPLELDYIRGRLVHTNRAWALPIVRALPGVAREALRRLGTDVILSRRLDGPSGAVARASA